jgi:hypothetical protein
MLVSGLRLVEPTPRRDAGCRRAGHCARRHTQSFAVGTARGASACAARDRPYDVGTATSLFIQYLASRNQHRFASITVTFTSPPRRFEAGLRYYWHRKAIKMSKILHFISFSKKNSIYCIFLHLTHNIYRLILTKIIKGSDLEHMTS